MANGNNGYLPMAMDGYGSQKFCPIIKSRCKDNCTLMKNGECLLALGLMGLDSLGSTFNEVDPEEVRSAVTFFTKLNLRPDYDLRVSVCKSDNAFNAFERN